MTQRVKTVVRKPKPLSKAELHAQLMVGWSRAISKFGTLKAFAEKMGLTVAGVNKQTNGGSMPDFATIMEVFDHDQSVLDEVFERKGFRLVDKEATCDTDDASLLIARLLVKLQEAEHPESPGGRSIVHSELLGMEALIRELHGASGNWLGEISELRRPRAVGGRS